VEQLARLVDEMDVDVFAFGITSDFRTTLFPGSQRLIELADKVQVLQVEALCWCGRRATQNARTVDGIMVVEGDQVMVGDVAPQHASEVPGLSDAVQPGADLEAALGDEPVVGYETLCRRHYMRRVTAHGANLMAGADQTLPFDVDACLWPGAGSGSMRR
jgi:thymidine kinase